MYTSNRYVAAVLALLSLAAVPTVIHSYIGKQADDGRSVREIPIRLADHYGAATSRRAGWGMDRFGSNEWIERHYGSTPQATLFVGRSYDPKRLYHHPELALDYGHDYHPVKSVALPRRPDLPVHVLTSAAPGERRVALYAMHYDRGYVENPIAFQLRNSFELLFSPRQPFTLFFAKQELGRGETPETSLAASLLLEAVSAFEAQTPDGR